LTQTNSTDNSLQSTSTNNTSLIEALRFVPQLTNHPQGKKLSVLVEKILSRFLQSAITIQHCITPNDWHTVVEFVSTIDSVMNVNTNTAGGLGDGNMVQNYQQRKIIDVRKSLSLLLNPAPSGNINLNPPGVGMESFIHDGEGLEGSLGGGELRAKFITELSLINLIFPLLLLEFKSGPRTLLNLIPSSILSNMLPLEKKLISLINLQSSNHLKLQFKKFFRSRLIDMLSQRFSMESTQSIDPDGTEHQNDGNKRVQLTFFDYTIALFKNDRNLTPDQLLPKRCLTPTFSNFPQLNNYSQPAKDLWVPFEQMIFSSSALIYSMLDLPPLFFLNKEHEQKRFQKISNAFLSKMCSNKIKIEHNSDPSALASHSHPVILKPLVCTMLASGFDHSEQNDISFIPRNFLPLMRQCARIFDSPNPVNVENVENAFKVDNPFADNSKLSTHRISTQLEGCYLTNPATLHFDVFQSSRMCLLRAQPLLLRLFSNSVHKSSQTESIGGAHSNENESKQKTKAKTCQTALPNPYLYYNTQLLYPTNLKKGKKQLQKLLVSFSLLTTHLWGRELVYLHQDLMKCIDLVENKAQSSQNGQIVPFPHFNPPEKLVLFTSISYDFIELIILALVNQSFGMNLKKIPQKLVANQNEDFSSQNVASSQASHIKNELKSDKTEHNKSNEYIFAPISLHLLVKQLNIEEKEEKKQNSMKKTVQNDKSAPNNINTTNATNTTNNHGISFEESQFYPKNKQVQPLLFNISKFYNDTVHSVETNNTVTSSVGQENHNSVFSMLASSKNPIMKIARIYIDLLLILWEIIFCYENLFRCYKRLQNEYNQDNGLIRQLTVNNEPTFTLSTVYLDYSVSQPEKNLDLTSVVSGNSAPELLSSNFNSPSQLEVRTSKCINSIQSILSTHLGFILDWYSEEVDGKKWWLKYFPNRVDNTAERYSQLGYGEQHLARYYENFNIAQNSLNKQFGIKKQEHYSESLLLHENSNFNFNQDVKSISIYRSLLIKLAPQSPLIHTTPYHLIPTYSQRSIIQQDVIQQRDVFLRRLILYLNTTTQYSDEDYIFSYKLIKRLRGVYIGGAKHANK
jgi:hypothetical protein